jgi:hypothetical protein
MKEFSWQAGRVAQVEYSWQKKMQKGRKLLMNVTSVMISVLFIVLSFQ